LLRNYFLKCHAYIHRGYLVRGTPEVTEPFTASLSSPDPMDIVATFDEHGAVLQRLPSAVVPTFVSDRVARLLFI